MRKVIAILLCLCLYSCSGNKKAVIGNNKKSVSVKIKSITYYCYGPYGGVSSHVDYYDTSGLLQVTMGNNGLEKWHVATKYKYNSLNEKIEEVHYLDDGKVYEDYTYEYNQQHQLIKSVNHLSDTTWNVVYTYKYDGKGNKIEEITKQNKVVIKRTYKYNEKGNKIEENNYDKFGSVDETYFYKYNDSDDIIETKTKTNYGESIFADRVGVRYEQMDTVGNWLKATEFSTGIPPSITKRVIAYY